MFKNTISNLKDSLCEFQKIPTITICAMLMALSIVLGAYSISIGNFIKIGFANIPNQMVAALFGGIVGSVFSGIADIVKFIVKPDGQFNIAFTFNSALAGFIYGIFYYKQSLSFKRILLAQLLVSIICNMLIGTLILTYMYGKVFGVIFPMRVLKNSILVPINSTIFFMLNHALNSIRNQVSGSNRSSI